MKAQYETQLVVRRMDENGDMIFGQGENGQLRGLEAMKQVLKTRLATVEGEWWEGDPGAIPYFTDVLGSPTSMQNKNAIDLMIIDRIMNTVGVISVSDVSSSIIGRRYSFSCSVLTVYGTTTAEVSV